MGIVNLPGGMRDFQLSNGGGSWQACGEFKYQKLRIEMRGVVVTTLWA